MNSIKDSRKQTSCKHDSIVSTVWIFIRGILSKKLKLYGIKNQIGIEKSFLLPAGFSFDW